MVRHNHEDSHWLKVIANRERGALYVQMGDGIAVVPVLEDGRVQLINELSIAYEDLWSLQPVFGTIEEGEEPATAARRELREELGFYADRIDYLGITYNSAKYIRNIIYIYVARGLTKGTRNKDLENRFIEVPEPIELDQLDDLIAAEVVCDSAAVVSLYLARQFLNKEAKKESTTTEATT